MNTFEHISTCHYILDLDILNEIHKYQHARYHILNLNIYEHVLNMNILEPVANNTSESEHV